MRTLTQTKKTGLLNLFFIFFTLFSFSTLSFANTTQLFVVDPSVSEYESMLQDLPKDTEILLLNQEGDALSQIALALSSYKPVGEIHIVSHARAGALSLAGERVDIHALKQQQSALNTIRRHLSESADIYLYGCDLAANEDGRNFVNVLAEKTGANVSASSNKTGAQALGGDWDLEYQTGKAVQPMLLSKTFQDNYKYTLAHFRGGSVTWQAAALDGDGVMNDVEITVKTAWGSFISGVVLNSTPALAFSVPSETIDNLGSYSLKTSTFTARNLDPNTEYLVYYTSNARISTLPLIAMENEVRAISPR